MSSFFSQLFASGRIVEAIVALMLLEVMILILVRKHGWLEFAPAGLIANNGAGAALLMALRASLQHRAWEGVAAWLLVALGFHVWELTLRGSTRRTPRASTRARTRLR